MIVRAAMVMVGLLVVAFSLVVGVVGLKVLSEPDGSVGGRIVLAVTLVVLLVGGSYVGYAFVRSAFRITKQGEPRARSVFRPRLLWLAVCALSLAAMPYPVPVAVRIIFFIALLVMALADLAHDLEPGSRKPPR